MSAPKEFSLIRESVETNTNISRDYEATYSRKMNFVSLKNDDEVENVVLTLAGMDIDNGDMVITVKPGEAFSGYFPDFSNLAITASTAYRLVVGGL